ncbi:murein biosynthesis integral membrane protein MurJ [Pannonibacter tanglangensis]|uniref:Probable lipid II flippase MurJ n=1 Tax=Pannonibacter tanglangensis TaxID=2750084 RepID=A0ABW9ZEE3_9HYPH|nr:murein biosynthesis integral membrane protein MurJ [Pannonibacter sp. XCT-34]NBN63184.1 murein biosynthesis integral membrane protein MurJ [Pannonibacter sp. XCT-34]
MLRRLSVIGGWTLVSRLFGFLRDLVMASVLGAGPLADAFLIAFRLPNHFRAIVAEGAFNAAFVPTYAATLERDGEARARAFRSQMLSWLMLVNLVLLALALLATGWLVFLLAPGLGTGEEGVRALAIDLTRITFPYLLCMSVVTLMSGVLNAERKFAAAAAAPILLNLAMIAAFFSVQWFPDAAHAAAWGTLAGGVLQVILLTAAVARAGLGFSLPLPRRDGEVALFFKRLGPALLTAGVVQVAVFADTILASFLPTGALAHLAYADRLYQLPLGVIGIALGTAVLPEIGRDAGVGAEDKARGVMDRALRICLMVGLPIGLAMAFLGEDAIRVLFQRGAFDAAATAGSAAVLAAYAVALPAALAIRTLVAAFNGRGDMTTPLKALAGATVVNVALKALLSAEHGAAGLAMGTSAGVWIYAVTLYVLCRTRGYVSPFALADKVLVPAAAVTMALVLWGMPDLLAPVEDVLLLLPALAAGLVWLALAAALSFGAYAVMLGGGLLVVRRLARSRR